MFRRLSGDRFRSVPSAQLTSLLARVRAWRLAGRDFQVADDLLHEIDQLERQLPRLSGRLECVRETLWQAFEDSVVSIS